MICDFCNTPHDEDTACPPIKKVRTTEFTYPFPAKYPGHCVGCNLPTYPGQMIQGKTHDHTTVYGHEGCFS